MFLAMLTACINAPKMQLQRIYIYAMSNIFLSNKLPLLQDVSLNNLLNVFFENYLLIRLFLFLNSRKIYMIASEQLIAWF